MYRPIGNIQKLVGDSQRTKPIAHIEWKPNRVAVCAYRVMGNITQEGVCQSGRQLHICRPRVRVVGKWCAIDTVTDSSPCWRNGLVPAGAHLLVRKDSKDKGV